MQYATHVSPEERRAFDRWLHSNTRTTIGPKGYKSPAAHPGGTRGEVLCDDCKDFFTDIFRDGKRCCRGCRGRKANGRDRDRAKAVITSTCRTIGSLVEMGEIVRDVQRLRRRAMDPAALRRQYQQRLARYRATPLI